jgi:polar amino acid transport system substrate-binding protein
MAGCHFPDDPEGTLDRVQNGRLRAGLSVREPWTRLADGKPAGPEAQLVEDFARELNAQVDWVVGAESELLAALQKRELDLVGGGLTEDTPWKDKLALTKPYLQTRITVGAPPGQEPPDRVKGLEVSVPSGRPLIAAYVLEKGGIPVTSVDPLREGRPVAADDFLLEAWGLAAADTTLHKERHVIAVAPGENRWLVRVEAFLRDRGESVRDQLRREAAR